MQALGELLKSWGRRGSARWWIGERPEGRLGQLPRLIAAEIGYPTAADDPFDGNGLVKLNDRQAAHVLAVAATVGLAYRFRAPKPQALKEASQALSGLGRNRAFFGNSLWDDAEVRGWTPMTSATFDCGLIGFDDECAFIFWIEDED